MENLFVSRLCSAAAKISISDLRISLHRSREFNCFLLNVEAIEVYKIFSGRIGRGRALHGVPVDVVRPNRIRDWSRGAWAKERSHCGKES